MSHQVALSVSKYGLIDILLDVKLLGDTLIKLLNNENNSL